jgi:NAD(P)H-dependent FMN reductase
MTKSSKKQILALSGSIRKNSSNNRILELIADACKDDAAIEIYALIDQLPHFIPGLQDDVLPVIVKDFLDKIQMADGVLICTPEYVFSLPAVLKNALEWTVSSTVLSDKPVAFIVASAGGEKAFESLDLIMSTLIQKAIPHNLKLLIRGAQGKVSDEGKFADKQVEGQLHDLMNAFIFSMQ